MIEQGLYECLDCEHRVYRDEDDDFRAGCPLCDGEMNNCSVRGKPWLYS